MKKIFILHGWTYATDKWEPFIKFMETHGVQSVLLKVPGLTKNTTTVWTLQKYVEWLRVQLDAEKETPILVGHSNGGRIALAFAAKYPNRLKQLILIDSAGIYHNELPLRLKRFIFRSIARLGKKITSSTTLRNVLYKAARESDYKNATPQMQQTMVHLISSDMRPQLDSIRTPSLIIWGRLDKSTPLSDGVLMQKHIQHAQLYVIDNAGHSPHATHPEEVGNMILKHI